MNVRIQPACSKHRKYTRNDISDRNDKRNETHQKNHTSRHMSYALGCAFTFRNNFLFIFPSYSGIIYHALQRFAEMNLEGMQSNTWS